MAYSVFCVMSCSYCFYCNAIRACPASARQALNDALAKLFSCYKSFFDTHSLNFSNLRSVDFAPHAIQLYLGIVTRFDALLGCLTREFLRRIFNKIRAIVSVNLSSAEYLSKILRKRFYRACWISGYVFHVA